MSAKRAQCESSLERRFLARWRYRYPGLEPELQFSEVPAWHAYAHKLVADGLRKRARPFVADFAWPAVCVIAEINGGTYAKKRGGHSSGTGIERDYLKATLAMECGWLVIPFSAVMVNSQHCEQYHRLANIIHNRMRFN